MLITAATAGHLFVARATGTGAAVTSAAARLTTATGHEHFLPGEQRGHEGEDRERSFDRAKVHTTSEVRLIQANGSSDSREREDDGENDGARLATAAV